METAHAMTLLRWDIPHYADSAPGMHVGPPYLMQRHNWQKESPGAVWQTARCVVPMKALIAPELPHALTPDWMSKVSLSVNH